MKRSNTKNETKKNTKSVDNWHDIAITLTAWEFVEGEKFDRLKCSVYAGKNDKGEYNRDIPVTVMIGEDTEIDDAIEKITDRTRVNVGGEIAFSRSTGKDGNEYINITVWATKVSIAE